MKCSKCAKDATIRATQIIEGQPRVEHFCEDHAVEHVGYEQLLRPVPWSEDDVRMPLKVTRAQIENNEPVSIRLPDGSQDRVRIPPGMQDGDRWILEYANEFGFRDKRKGRLCLVLEVVPESDLEDA